MAGLGETTALLARLKRQAERFAQTGGAGGPDPRVMRETAFAPNPGELRMLSYAPEGLAAGSPLVVVLHGCTQTAEAHAAGGGWLTLADRFGFAVVAPEQRPGNNSNRCFNWFEPEDARRGRGEAASIAAMVVAAVKEHGSDPQRVFVTGLSAGGAMTSVMLAAYPEVFAGGGIVAGLPYGVADTLSEALSAMFGGRVRSAAELGKLVRRQAPAGARIPRVAIWHGDADATVRPHNADEIGKQWAAAHGLGEQADRVERLKGRIRESWVSPTTGEVLIESVLIAGLGHGTPLHTGGPEGVGTAGPYMLEAGVSSSLEICRFWGIAPAAVAEEAVEHQADGDDDGRDAASWGIGDQVMDTIGRHVPGEVGEVVARALRTAGLMR